LDKEHDDYLCQNYPILYQDRRTTVEDIYTKQGSLMGFGFECRDGWFYTINKLSEKLEFLNNQDVGFQIVAVQVKEKFGTMRFYFKTIGSDGVETENLNIDFMGTARFVKTPESVSLWYTIVNELVCSAEQSTERICEVCGKPSKGPKRYGGWVRTLCEEHEKEELEAK
jgi:hypothetical protein